MLGAENLEELNPLGLALPMNSMKCKKFQNSGDGVDEEEDDDDGDDIVYFTSPPTPNSPYRIREPDKNGDDLRRFAISTPNPTPNYTKVPNIPKRHPRTRKYNTFPKMRCR